MNHNGNAHEITIPEKIFRYIEKGWSYGQTAEALSMPKATVYKTYQREAKRRETFTETPGNGEESDVRNKQENVNIDTENAVSPVSKPVQNVSSLRHFCKDFAQTFHPADLVFYATVSIGGLGVSQALPGVGVAVSVLWFFVAVIYLHRLKMFARWFDAVVLAGIEVAAGVPAHYTWATNALWANVNQLPISVYVEKYKNGAGEWVAFYTGRDVEVPFYIACYIAAMLAFFGACAVGASVLANKKNNPA